MVRTVVSMQVQEPDLDRAWDALSALETGFSGRMLTERPGGDGPLYLRVAVPGDARDEVARRLADLDLPYKAELEEVEDAEEVEDP
ncbi:hypothetical protein [Streptomyces lavendulocolor]|uniref:hypothetical protein n=1 Tax=Streptomyces lavendulocolor TaxID=67316 RepID=UPI003C2DA048